MSAYKVAVFEDAGKISFYDEELRLPEDDEVLLKVDSCAICTLEQRLYTGTMKNYPFAGGHEVAGTVIETGKNVTGVKPGDKAAVRILNSCGECYYCRSGHENLCVKSFIANTQKCAMGAGGFAEYMTVSASSVYRMADDVDLSCAALSEPLGCCVHSIENACIGLSDDVVVIGVGIMGALHIQLAKLKGARVIACELDGHRMEVARQMGADIVLDSGHCDPVEEVKKLTEGRGADVVICTVPSAPLAEQAVDMAGNLGRTVFYTSFHPDNPVKISPSHIHYSEQVITGSVNPQRKDFLTAVRLISYGLIDVSGLISGKVSLDNLEEGLKEAVRPDTYRIIVQP